jgi:hypothetical protein
MRRFALPFSLTLIAAACGSGFPMPKTACVPNAAIACVGVGACMGSQTCKADGSGYNACICGASPDGGTGTDAGGMGLDAGPDVNDGCVRVAPNFLCGLAPQCGCGANQTCDVDYPTKSTGETICVQSTANGGLASHCTQTANCAPGLSCWGGVCRPYCANEGVQCNTQGTGVCEQLHDANNAAIPNATVCSLHCRLDDPSTCGGSTEGCIWLGGNETDCADLYSYNTISCSAQKPWCAPGYECLQNNTCAKWCQVGQGYCGGMYCTPFGSPFIVQGVEYGVCQ